MKFRELFEPTVAKALAWISLFLAPVRATMIAVSVMVLIDLITGIWAAHRRKEKITSNGIRRTISKTLAYQIAIFSSFLMEKYFLSGIPVVKVVAGLIGTTEFKSVLENLSSITGIDFLQVVIEKFQGKKIVPEPKDPPKKD
jgi:hypothetical protein